MGCITDTAYSTAASQQANVILRNAIVDTAIQIGLALWQRNAKRSINEMQVRIADRQMVLAEQLQAHAEKFWPLEDEFVSETFGEAKAEPHYAGTAAGWGEIAQEAVDDGQAVWRAEARRQCVAPTRCEDARYQRMGVAVRADVQAFALRTEEARAQETNDRRYERMYKVLGLGRGLLSSVAGFQNAHLRAGTAAANLLDGAVTSALRTFGYFRTPNDPGQWGYGSRIRETFESRAPSFQASVMGPPSALSAYRYPALPSDAGPPRSLAGDS